MEPPEGKQKPPVSTTMAVIIELANLYFLVSRGAQILCVDEGSLVIRPLVWRFSSHSNWDPRIQCPCLWSFDPLSKSVIIIMDLQRSQRRVSFPTQIYLGLWVSCTVKQFSQSRTEHLSAGFNQSQNGGLATAVQVFDQARSAVA